jgi:hypothetical protein
LLALSGGENKRERRVGSEVQEFRCGSAERQGSNSFSGLS